MTEDTSTLDKLREVIHNNRMARAQTHARTKYVDFREGGAASAAGISQRQTFRTCSACTGKSGNEVRVRRRFHGRGRRLGGVMRSRQVVGGVGVGSVLIARNIQETSLTSQCPPIQFGMDHLES